MARAAEVHGISERHACGLFGLARSSCRYTSRRGQDTALRMRLRELALDRPRYGYRRLHVLLQREGWRVNHKKVFRLYGEEELLVRTKRRKKIASHMRTTPPAPSRPSERWSMDFVCDQLADGRRLRALTVIDTFTRECLAVEATLPRWSSSVLEAGLSLDTHPQGEGHTTPLDNTHFIAP